MYRLVNNNYYRNDNVGKRKGMFGNTSERKERERERDRWRRERER